VGSDCDARVRPERVIFGQGFRAKDVQSGMGNLACVQRCQQGCIINQRAASRV
jgi:hypothetical protein